MTSTHLIGRFITSNPASISLQGFVPFSPFFSPCSVPPMSHVSSSAAHPFPSSPPLVSQTILRTIVLFSLSPALGQIVFMPPSALEFTSFWSPTHQRQPTYTPPFLGACSKTNPI